MILREWCERWNISAEAEMDLRFRMGVRMKEVTKKGQSEAAVQQRVSLEAANRHWLLWRNNVGAYKPETGGFVRYGLANESHQMNRRFKSGDLIGLRPVLIQEKHLGQTIGQFVSVETKAENWKSSNTPHEKAQERWASLINTYGGHAVFATRGSDIL